MTRVVVMRSALSANSSLELGHLEFDERPRQFLENDFVPAERVNGVVGRTLNKQKRLGTILHYSDLH